MDTTDVGFVLQPGLGRFQGHRAAQFTGRNQGLVKGFRDTKVNHRQTEFREQFQGCAFIQIAAAH